MALTVNEDVAEMDRDFRRQSDAAMLTLQGMEKENKTCRRVLTFFEKSNQHNWL